MLLIALFTDPDEASSAVAKVPSSSRRFYVLTKRDDDQQDASDFVGCFFKVAAIGSVLY
jgi:hypothetical protein